MRLSDLKKGKKAVVIKVHGYGLLRKRLSEIGFIRGKIVQVVYFAPLGDPIVYRVLGSEIALRLDAASMIEVEPIQNDQRET